ncbi:MAG: hypothetical protein LBU28_03885 [Spirochaetaceae bacterium]|jgi:hypothetical protein|nr:hypothetical protein [Spirochaetaceae bacterium]
MGLLSKAISSNFQELDALGKTLRDRIQRLPSKKTSPYAALSLLKVYGNFNIAACLMLRGEAYLNYTAVGLGFGKIAFPRDRLPALGPAGIKLDQSLSFLPAQISPQSAVWLFPLEDGAPPEFLLLIVEDRPSMFRPQFVSRILPHIRNRLIPPEAGPPEQAAAEPPPEPEKAAVAEAAQQPEKAAATEAAQEPGKAAATEAARKPGKAAATKPPQEPGKAVVAGVPPVKAVAAVRVPPVKAVREPAAAAVAGAPPVVVAREPAAELKARIIQYGQEHERMSGIVFGYPEAAGSADPQEQIAAMSSPFALTIGLSSGRCLILFPPSMDSGLVAHRISRSLKTEALCSFEAKDPEGVYEALKPYMAP